MASSFLSSTTFVTGATIQSRAHVGRPASGRPQDLLDHHELVTITGGDMWEAAERFVHDTYVALGYTAPSARRHVEELAPYEGMSTFHAVVDDEHRIIGTIRSIYATYDELPIGKFHPLEGRHPDLLCELSSLVVSPTLRSTGVIEHLYRVGWLDAYRLGCSALVAIIDDWLLRTFQDTYRLPFRQLGNGHEYMGGVPVPAVLALDGHYEACIDENPEFASWMLAEVTTDELLAWGITPPPPTAQDPPSVSGVIATRV